MTDARQHARREPTSRAVFFPATCCSPASRRQLLAGGAAVAAITAFGLSPAHASADARAIITAHVRRSADPWAVAHGLRAMGRGFTVGTGQRAVDFLLERQVTSVTVNGRTAFGFPRDVEVHANSFLKTMLEAAVPLDYRFTHQGKRRTLVDLVEGARLLFRPSQLTAPNEIPWSLIAFSRTTSSVRRRWTNAWGQPVDLDALVDGALRDLENASAPVDAAMRAGQPLGAPPPPVHGLTCGGTHMLYGLLSAISYGFGPKGARQRVEHQTTLMVWRMGGADVDLIARHYVPLPRSVLNNWRELNAKLKVLGHAEECLAFATTRVGIRLTPAQQAQRAAGVQTLHRLLADLSRRNLSQIRALELETYRQLIGDTCHAEHALTLRP